MSAYNKYHVSAKNERTLDGIVFDSKKEMYRYRELKLLEKTRAIKYLKLQPEFPLQVAFTDRTGKKHRAITYQADFSYFDCKKEIYIVEDVKGVLTPIYRLKKKLLLFNYPNITFREI